MTDPATEFLKLGDVERWLGQLGIAPWLVAKLIENGTIAAIRFPGAKRNHYSRTQIRRDVVDKHTQQQITSGEGPASAATTAHRERTL